MLFFFIIPLMICSAQVTDDIYEQNDSFSTAKGLYLGSTTDLYLADNDYYKFFTAVQGELKISVSIVGSQEELNYNLKDDMGADLAEGQYNSSTSKKEILTNVGGNAWLYLYFNRGSSSNPSIPYTITILFTSTTSSSEDVHEQNDNFDQAMEISLVGASQLFLMDDDWFKFYTPDPGNLIINVSYTGAANELAYDLVSNSSSTSILASGQNYPGSTSLDIITNIGGNAFLYLHIKRTSSSSFSVPYAIKIQYSPSNNTNNSTDSSPNPDGKSDGSTDAFENPFGNIAGYSSELFTGLTVMVTGILVRRTKKS